MDEVIGNTVQSNASITNDESIGQPDTIMIHLPPVSSPQQGMPKTEPCEICGDLKETAFEMPKEIILRSLLRKSRAGCSSCLLMCHIFDLHWFEMQKYWYELQKHWHELQRHHMEEDQHKLLKPRDNPWGKTGFSTNILERLDEVDRDGFMRSLNLGQLAKEFRISGKGILCIQTLGFSRNMWSIIRHVSLQSQVRCFHVPKPQHVDMERKPFEVWHFSGSKQVLRAGCFVAILLELHYLYHCEYQ